MNKKLETLKKIWVIIKDYYNSLTPAGKILFVCVMILIKLGPDMILFPMLYKHIEKRRIKKLDKQADEFENEIDFVLSEIDLK